MPKEVTRLADQIRRAARGHAWSGPSAREALEGVDATHATAHPVPGAHSIWELVRHLTVWCDAGRRRLAGEVIPDLTPDEDFPPLRGNEPAIDWARDQQRFYNAADALASAVEALSDPALDTVLEGPHRYTIYQTAHGVAQHILYHTGQITLLKRALHP